jgi:hypothetical protein
MFLHKLSSGVIIEFHHHTPSVTKPTRYNKRKQNSATPGRHGAEAVCKEERMTTDFQ